jgi:hypothetical protein
MGRKTDPRKPDVHAPTAEQAEESPEVSQKHRQPAPNERGAWRASLYGMMAAVLAVGLGVFLVRGLEPPARQPGTTAAQALAGDDGAPVIFAWSVAHSHWGTEAVLIRRDGRARYLLDPPSGGGTPIRTELTLPAEDIAELERRVVEAHPCDLVSERRTGREHESRPVLEVSLPSAHCSVSMWFDEWRESPRARPMAAIVTELRDSLRHAGSQ